MRSKLHIKSQSKLNGLEILEETKYKSRSNDIATIEIGEEWKIGQRKWGKRTND